MQSNRRPACKYASGVPNNLTSNSSVARTSTKSLQFSKISSNGFSVPSFAIWRIDNGSLQMRGGWIDKGHPMADPNIVDTTQLEMGLVTQPSNFTLSSLYHPAELLEWLWIQHIIHTICWYWVFVHSGGVMWRICSDYFSCFLSRLIRWFVAFVLHCFSVFALFVYLKFSCPESLLFSLWHWAQGLYSVASPHNSVSDTGHKSALGWSILTGYEPCAPGTLGLCFRPPSCSWATFYSCYINFHSASLCSTPRTRSPVLPSHPQPFLSSWPTTLPVLRPLPSRNSPPPTTQPGRGRWRLSCAPKASGPLSVVLRSALMTPMRISRPNGTLGLTRLQASSTFRSLLSKGPI